MDDTPTRLRPLTRSLDPLDGESLYGFLLRLAYRLRVGPRHLAHLAGCTFAGENVGRRHLLDLDMEVFARVTRLTADEAADLTLIPWKDRYPPIARSLPTMATRRPKPDDWLFTLTPRHCPQCLAGDGTPIQQRYGGPWKRSWLLPIVFACPDHQVFLQQGCPASHPRQRHLGHLILRSREPTLHPTQCRVSLAERPGSNPPGAKPKICGVRLDQSPDDIPPRPGASELQSQQRLLDLLGPDRPPEKAARFFTDVRMLASLICVSWPLGRDLFDTAMAPAITEHVRAREQSLTPHDDLPDAPAATGALLTAAIALLDAPEMARPLARHIRAAWPGLAHSIPWAESSLAEVLRNHYWHEPQ
ncbi:TniQ family protein [Nonomuraea turcica]|uniref:TniQ family protein n=1 Tax=Nonomuraea sp. G32 TaxID=3067274 RepID=UPI00273ABB0D|nr:TniQ family protein [Nonomuraea sp. G32]MDP4512116.1 TniQ family protein [Nonomuraea sp. G32]